METNPRSRIGEWAPPPPVVPQLPPRPPLAPTPTSEEEFDGLLGNLVEHYSALPPPAFGESPIDEKTQETKVRKGPPAWVWAISGVVVLGATAAALVFTGVVNLQLLGVGGAIDTPAVTPAPQPSADEVASRVKLRVAPPKAEPLPAPAPVPTAVPLATESAVPIEDQAVANKPPVPVVKKRKRITRVRRKRVTRRQPTRETAKPKKVAEDWTDPYQ